MSTAASTIAIIGAIVALFGGQAFWLGRALDGVQESVRDLRGELRDTRVELRDTRVELRGEIADVRTEIAGVRTTFLKDYGERITRLEERIER